MKTLNSVIIEGNMVNKPVLKLTPNGMAMCNFSIAANTIAIYKKDDEFMQKNFYFDIDTWGKLAELCNQNGEKGRAVRVVGRLKQDRWTGSDGKNCSKVKIIAEHVEFKPITKKENEGVNYD